MFTFFYNLAKLYDLRESGIKVRSFTRSKVTWTMCQLYPTISIISDSAEFFSSSLFSFGEAFRRAPLIRFVAVESSPFFFFLLHAWPGLCVCGGRGKTVQGKRGMTSVGRPLHPPRYIRNPAVDFVRNIYRNFLLLAKKKTSLGKTAS